MATSEVRRAVLVLTSISSPAAGRKLARALVAERLSACVSIVPRVESIYRWKGAVQNERETLLLIKTVPHRLGLLRRRLRDLHPYQVPEVLALDAEAAEPYAAWLLHETQAK